jgi:MFS family permease
MSSPSIKLYRMRGIFFVYFIAKSLIGVAVAWSVMHLAGPANLLNREIQVNFNKFSPQSFILFTLTITAVILLLAWLVFGQLLQRKNWARVLLLVVGWLTVISAVFSLLTTVQSSHFVGYIAEWFPEMDWKKLLEYDRVQKIFELLFWGYLISVLQFDQGVRDEFFPPEPVKKMPEK